MQDRTTPHYYAIVWDTSSEDIYLIKSAEYFSIGKKLRNFSENRGFCSLCDKINLHKILEDYEWCHAGEMRIFPKNKRYFICIHQTSGNELPAFYFSKRGFRVFRSQDPIKDAKAIILIKEGFKDCFLWKKCHAELIPIKTNESPLNNTFPFCSKVVV